MSTRQQSARWLRFSLRTLLVFVVLTGTCLGLLNRKMQRAGKQREAVNALRSMSYSVHYDYDFDENGEWIKHAVRTQPHRHVRY